MGRAALIIAFCKALCGEKGSACCTPGVASADVAAERRVVEGINFDFSSASLFTEYNPHL